MTNQPANPLENQAAIAQLASSSDERFARMEALLLSTVERNNESSAILQRTTVKQERHADEIDTLLGAVSTNEVGIRALTENVDRVLSQIAQGNQRFDVLRGDAMADRATADQKIQALREDATADRAAADQKIQAQGERIDRVLDELVAQRESMRALLSAMATTNGRVDELEQAG